MQLFVANEVLARLESAPATRGGVAPWAGRLELAWHLRQRDSARALLLADQIESELSGAEHPHPDLHRGVARLALLRAEVSLLRGERVAAQRWTQAAARGFEALQDRLGQGDVAWLEASIAVDWGPPEEIDASLLRAMAAYESDGDALRLEHCRARRLVYGSFRDPVATAAQLEREFPAGPERVSSLAAFVAATRGNIAVLTDDPAASVGHYLASYHAAIDSGQLRQALVAQTNAVESLASLGDLDGALGLSESALALARQTGWPASIGLCLYQIGDVMRLLARHDEAQAYLHEALSVMEGAAGSRNHEQVVGCLGQLALDVGAPAQAMDWFTRFEQRVKLHGEPDSMIKAWRGQASALLRLGRSMEACVKAEAALALARQNGNAEGQIQALRVLGQIHGEPNAPALPNAVTAPSVALHYLHQALDVAATVSGYRLSPELLTDVSAAYAACGDFENAYRQRLAADLARSQLRSRQAQKRALSMQIRQQIDLARAETEHHRQQAATLAETSATLETLGTVGREITGSLDGAAVFDALLRHVHQLLDATFFAVYLIDESGQALTMAFGAESGRRLPVRSVAMDNPTSKLARCARERQELVLELAPEYDDPNRIPGTVATLSLLYAPLLVGERLLGVMTIQSPQAQAYGARERSIFRALCAYGAIALDNAAAYASAEAAQRRADEALRALRQTQAQLIEQNRQLERLAVTDQLTGLANRLRLDQALEDERLRTERYGGSFCVVLLDIDHFKLVNDRFGHQMGDQVLTGFARVLEAHTREVDVVGRWGGEEFLVICRDGLEPALLLAEKLRRAIQSHVFALVGRKSASLGVALFHRGETVAEAIARADAALYQAKQDGRNRVVSGD